MNAERLLNAARAVREGAADKFTMLEYTHPCGTPACVLGHYAARADLQQDFSLAPGPEGWYLVLTSDGSRVHYDDYAVLEHFGVTHLQSAQLFSRSGCASAKTSEAAAAYIEEFVRVRTSS